MTDRTTTTASTPAADASTVQLVERLTEQVSTLVRTEIRHGLGEVKEKGSRLGIGIGISGAGVLLLFFGLATLVATAVLGLATVLDVWLAALIVALVVLAIGGILAAVGAKRAKSAVPPVPADTVSSVQDDITTIKKGIQ